MKVKKEKTQVEIPAVVFLVREYKGAKIMIRKLGVKTFEYIVFYRSNFFSNFIEIYPNGDATTLNKEEDKSASGIIFTAACTTVDALVKETEEAEKEAVKRIKKDSTKVEVSN